MNQEPVATFVICDDIRTEITGKSVLVGVYANNILVPKLPAKLPKLAFLVKLRSSIKDPHHWMAARIETPGSEPFLSQKVELRGNIPNGESEKGAQYVESSQPIEISPYEIKEKGRIKVWVQSDKGEHYAGSVLIETAESLPAFAHPLQALNAGAICLAFYSRMRDTLGRELAEGLAASIANFVADNIQSQALQSMPESADCVLRISPNRFVAFFAQPREKPPEVSILDLPEGAHAEISKVNQFGFTVRITPTEAAPEDLKYTAL